MPATLNVNMLTVVHKGSGGVAMSFPDVCKTPAPPAPPIPIPYPNIAQSSDTADGTSSVKVDGNPIMLKKSNFRMSTGDEPGSLFGVVSNKVKGKAFPVMYSFDVKADGDNVFRLTDPMQTNSGSPANTLCPAECQAPNPALPSVNDGCRKTKRKKEEQKKEGTSWGKSGIVKKHRAPIQQVTTELNVIVYFRSTKKECARWINKFHGPKPHSCLSGTTIRAKDRKKVNEWLKRRWKNVSEVERRAGYRVDLDASNEFYGRSASAFVGIIGKAHGDDEIEPLRGRRRYNDKWMTGDYDVFQVLKGTGPCEIVREGPDFSSVRRRINKRLEWSAIQHPPQAQWAPKPGELKDGSDEFDMNVELNAEVKRGTPPWKKVIFDPKRKPMAVLDRPLTAVAGKNVVTLKNRKSVVDALRCKGCGQD